MPKTTSAKEFQDRFRAEEIIPIRTIDTPNKLDKALQTANINGTQQRILAYEVMNERFEGFDKEIRIYKQPRRVEKAHKKYYVYRGRISRSVGRDTREEIITDYKGDELKRYRDYKTGKFTINPNRYRVRHIKRYGNKYKVFVDPKTGRYKKWIKE